MSPVRTRSRAPILPPPCRLAARGCGLAPAGLVACSSQVRVERSRDAFRRTRPDRLGARSRRCAAATRVPLDAAESTWDPWLWALYLRELAEQRPPTPRTEPLPSAARDRRLAHPDLPPHAHGRGRATSTCSATSTTWSGSAYVVELAAAHADALGLGFEATRALGGIWIVRRHDVLYHANVPVGATIRESDLGLVAARRAFAAPRPLRERGRRAAGRGRRPNGPTSTRRRSGPGACRPRCASASIRSRRSRTAARPTRRRAACAC